MSNAIVGTVYSRIVDEVVNACRQAFEEEGAQPNVLDDFKKEWQKKISQRKVAQMPWDPPPVAATPAPNAVPPTRPQPYAAPVANSAQANDVRIKAEPGTSYDLQNLADNPAPSYSASNAPLAYSNASQQLREQFGDQANASIKQINERAQEASGSSQGQKRPLPAGSPTQDNPDSKRRATEYQMNLQQPVQPKVEQITSGQSAQASLGAAQTDGSAEWQALVAERTFEGPDTQAADHTISDLVRAQWQVAEGNGLMQPSSSKSRSHRAALHQGPSSSKDKKATAQTDGVDEDDDDDLKDDPDQLIGSDLDDPEEQDEEDEEDVEDPQQLIVCTYEKVARVKNKWKCTLKDGILINGGQEYVFAKATGEFEW